jgi:hypothetical protein
LNVSRTNRTIGISHASYTVRCAAGFRGPALQPSTKRTRRRKALTDSFSTEEEKWTGPSLPYPVSLIRTPSLSSILTMFHHGVQPQPRPPPIQCLPRLYWCQDPVTVRNHRTVLHETSAHFDLPLYLVVSSTPPPWARRLPLLPARRSSSLPTIPNQTLPLSEQPVHPCQQAGY